MSAGAGAGAVADAAEPTTRQRDGLAQKLFVQAVAPLIRTASDFWGRTTAVVQAALDELMSPGVGDPAMQEGRGAALAVNFIEDSERLLCEVVKRKMEEQDACAHNEVDDSADRFPRAKVRLLCVALIHRWL